MTIYVVIGILEEDISNAPVVLKAFTLRENAENYCVEQLDKPDNSYEEVQWQATELLI